MLLEGGFFLIILITYFTSILNNRTQSKIRFFIAFFRQIPNFGLPLPKKSMFCLGIYFKFAVFGVKIVKLSKRIDSNFFGVVVVFFFHF